MLLQIAHILKMILQPSELGYCTKFAEISDFSLLSIGMFDQIRGVEVLQHVQTAFCKEYKIHG